MTIFIIFKGETEPVQVPPEVNEEGGTAIEHWRVAEQARRDAAAKRKKHQDPPPEA